MRGKYLPSTAKLPIFKARLVSGDNTSAVPRVKRLRQCEDAKPESSPSPGSESEERPGIASGLVLFLEPLLEEGGLLNALTVSIFLVCETEDRSGARLL